MVDNVIEQSSGDNWQIYNADCVEAVGNLPDDSVGFSVFSPPFASLYTYSNSERDMGNCASDSDFWRQFSFLIAELFSSLSVIPGICGVRTKILSVFDARYLKLLNILLLLFYN